MVRSVKPGEARNKWTRRTGMCVRVMTVNSVSRKGSTGCIEQAVKMLVWKQIRKIRLTECRDASEGCSG